MSRIFWVGVGAAATVVAVTKSRKLVRRYLPEEVAARAQERAGQSRERLLAAAGEFKKEFTQAQKGREVELREALLAFGQGDLVAAKAAARRAAKNESAE